MKNGGGQCYEPEDGDQLALMFAPAEHTEGMKRRKERKRRERRERMLLSKTNPNKSTDEVNISTASSNATPKASGGSPLKNYYQQQQPEFNFPSNTSNAQRVRASPHRESRQGTPPSARPPMAASPSTPRHGEQSEDLEDDADVWYGKWWMFCFPDLIKTMTETR